MARVAGLLSKVEVEAPCLAPRVPVPASELGGLMLLETGIRGCGLIDQLLEGLRGSLMLRGKGR